MWDLPDHPLATLPFPSTPAEWQESAATWGTIGLEIMGHPVIERWEGPYMAELARRAASLAGRVLEIGFGLGIAAEGIQSHRVAEHWIVEANNDVFAALQRWAGRASSPVKCFHGFWEDVTSQFPSGHFDGILFDPYPINHAQLREQRFSFFHEALRLLRPGGVFTHYSGETAFTEQYRQRLGEAGFVDYEGGTVAVKPPAGCMYWSEPRMLAISAWKR